MNATTLLETVLGIAQAIAILTIYPERTRQREIAAAKRNIAERKAQFANRKAEIETELQELKRKLAAPTPENVPAVTTAPPQPELPNPWELETEAVPAPTAMPAAGVAIATATITVTDTKPAVPELKPEVTPKAKKTAANPHSTKPKRRSTTAKKN